VAGSIGICNTLIGTETNNQPTVIETSNKTQLLPDTIHKREFGTQTNVASTAEIKLSNCYDPLTQKPKNTTATSKNLYMDDDPESDTESNSSNVKPRKLLKAKQKLRSQTRNSISDHDSVSNASDAESSVDTKMWVTKCRNKKRIIPKLKQKVNLQRLVKQEIAKLSNGNSNLASPSTRRLFGKRSSNLTFQPTIYDNRPIYSNHPQLPMLCR
jgi:hypothetical protein